MNTNLNFGSVSTDQLAVTADLMNALPSLELTDGTVNHRLGKRIAGAGLAVALSAGVIAHQGNENSAFAADYETSVTAPLSEATAGPSREVSKPAESRNKELFITADHAEAIELTRDLETDKLFIEIGTIGEKPCGPQVDKAEVARRLENGEAIVKPDETADFLNKNPQVEKGLNARYDEKSNGDTEWIDFLIDELDIKNDDILQGGEDAGVRGLKARSEAAVLAQDINVENNACDLETGKIFANPGPNNAYNHLQKGEPVWTINIPASVLKKMEKENITLPDSLVIAMSKDGKMAEIIFERIGCNNPLFDLEQPPVEEKPPVTTVVETTVPEESTTTTTTPNTTTSSTTSTTTPGTTSSTTSTTMPTTTSSSTTSTTTPSTTSSTTSTTSTTSTSTTSTTVPHTTTTTTTPATTSTRPEVTVPVDSIVISGPGAGGTPDTDNNPDNNVTTSQVTTTTERPTNPSAPTTTIRPAVTTPPNLTTTTLVHVDVE